MYIEGFREAVELEIENRINDATKYNGAIFSLTRKKQNLDMKYGNHGDIIKYIDEEVETIDDVKEVLKAFIQGLNKEV
jgi:RNA binding exosome subunit